MVITDQLPRFTLLHLFECEYLRYPGAFQGMRPATDSALLPLGPFREGAFRAIHNDRSLVAFVWRQAEAAVLK